MLSHEGIIRVVERCATTQKRVTALVHEPYDPARPAMSRFLVPLAGLEPATCCLGEVSVKTLCRSAKVLVVSDRKAKVISWPRRSCHSANAACTAAISSASSPGVTAMVESESCECSEPS
jgi:hypothetical protein